MPNDARCSQAVFAPQNKFSFVRVCFVYGAVERLQEGRGVPDDGGTQHAGAGRSSGPVSGGQGRCECMLCEMLRGAARVREWLVTVCGAKPGRVCDAMSVCCAQPSLESMDLRVPAQRHANVAKSGTVWRQSTVLKGTNLKKFLYMVT